MSEFKLDPQLEKDSFLMGDLSLCQLRLINNALVPWFILVPRCSKLGQSCTELHLLSHENQITLLEDINQVSRFLNEEYQPDKINIATIGNIVQQLHVHIIGRYRDDFCWPNVVWGQAQKKAYPHAELAQIQKKIYRHFKQNIVMK